MNKEKLLNIISDFIKIQLFLFLLAVTLGGWLGVIGFLALDDDVKKEITEAVLHTNK